ncbi:shikimate kinase [Planococcus sp. APC 3906]|uniref:shikimate kinase n=1 Tax=Planococcus sp. APC 3906 TaxID=3035194 RepID=UPI0025B414C4|nr:shikimate kinase [Planococcus sp. APC 3906]MDN3448827.1 shikimate kinase [Planococcus sp. APC 3906]
MKIQIIGGSGTGKTTLGEYIGEREGVRWIDTDRYIWKGDGFIESYAVEERLAMYRRDMESSEGYVASGSVYAWCKEGFNDRELLVFLFLDEDLRLQRLRAREAERNSPFSLNEKGEMTNEFLEWCQTYLKAEDKEMVGTYAEHAHQMAIAKSPVLKLDSSWPIEELHARIMAAYKLSAKKRGGRRDQDEA